MDEIQDALSGMNAMLVLWVAVGLAAIFVCLILYDSSRRKRKRGRNNGSGRSASSAGGLNPIGHFKRLRAFYRSVDEELVRRQRQSARNRHRDK